MGGLQHRSAQRDQPYVEPVRGLGTTWHARGVAYWCRRVVWALTWLFLALVGGAFSALVSWEFWSDPAGTLPVRIGATTVGVVVTGWAAVATERSARHPANRSRRGLAGNSTGLVGVIRVLVLLLSAVAVCYFLTLGSMSVVFAHSLGREYGDEHEARLRVQARREHHGDPAPLDHRRRRHR